ncbi:MAG: LysE family translocator [Methanoregula sp.]|nr:LysE family translocator [Methanoregula sp.]
MIFEFLNMILLGFLIGLTGALAPGPTLIATINASLKQGWSAGPLVTLGHILVEVVMVGLIVAGLSLFIGDYAWLIAGIGGFALVIFGILTVLESRQVHIDITGNNQPTTSPLLAGALTSISNPYFWIWWFTVGSALLIGAYQGGIILVLAFILGHWMADLGWFTLVSVSIHKGRFILGEKQYRLILAACGVFLMCFGGYYLYTAGKNFS